MVRIVGVAMLLGLMTGLGGCGCCGADAGGAGDAGVVAGGGRPALSAEEPFFFIQMSDPQFGMFEQGRKEMNFRQEINNYTMAMAEANRLKPRFVVVTGDLINDPGDVRELAILRRINATLDPSIPLHLVAGNHDVGNEPTAQSLADYRKTIGPDHFVFVEGASHFIVLNSCICHSPKNVPDEWLKQVEFLKQELGRAAGAGAKHIILFMHHPLFLEKPDEKDQYFVVPTERRKVILELLRAHKVSAVFAGHYHRNAYGKDGAMEMVTTGPVGKPLGKDPSGFRIIKVYPDRLEHAYHGLGQIPDSVQFKKPAANPPKAALEAPKKTQAASPAIYPPASASGPG